MKFAFRECKIGISLLAGGGLLGWGGMAAIPSWTPLWQSVMVLSGIGLAGLLFFFRDPDRTTLRNDRVILAPADGTVVALEEGVEHPFIGGRGKRVSVFLSVFNVHVQRSPIDGLVEVVEYRPGRFNPAWRARASIENQQNLIGIRQPGFSVALCQIAGALARRTVSWVGVGDRLRAGDRVGLIKFGSRVDLYVPDSVEFVVKIKDKVKAGTTIIGVVR